MYLTTHEIAQTREHALNNLLGLSSACFEAGRRFSELFSASSRDAIQHGSKHCSLLGHGQIESMTQFPATLWVEQTARAARMLDGALEILGETHKAMIRSAEAQVRVFDEIAFATINRASKSSPWEAEVALRAMKTSLETAENSLAGMSAAAIETVNLAEQEGHQVAEALADQPGPARKRPAVRKRDSQ